MTIASSLRFSKAVRRNPELSDASASVLELTAEDDSVERMLGRPVTRVSLGPGEGVRAWPLTVTELATALPADSFDAVIVHGLLEHLAPGQRRQAVELLVAKTLKKLVLISTCDPVAGRSDAALAGALGRLGDAVSSRLVYRGANALPTVRDIYRALQVAGCSFSVLGNQSLLQHQAGVLMDALSPVTRPLMEAHGEKCPHGAPFADSEWDQYYDFLFEVDRAAGDPTPLAPPEAAEDSRPRLAQTRIYAVTHIPGADARLEPITPLYVGKAADAAPEGSLTDEVHAGPPLDNSRWCELTAVYKIWKEGPASDVVGFCHYRRFLDFAHPDRRTREVRIGVDQLRSRAADLTFDAGVTEGRGSDWLATAFPTPARHSIWDGYCSAHSTMDYCRVLNAIGRRRSYLMPFVSQQLGTNAMYSNNLFVTSWPLFLDLCATWFDVLGEYERQTPRHDASPYQNRDIGFLSERVFDIWVRYRRQRGTAIFEYPLYWVGDDAASVTAT
jgi:hypothetical protein